MVKVRYRIPAKFFIVLILIFRSIEKTDSVQKRVEEFEKKAKGILAPNKLPIKTPEKKQTPKSAGLMIAKVILLLAPSAFIKKIKYTVFFFGLDQCQEKNYEGCS